MKIEKIVEIRGKGGRSATSYRIYNRDSYNNILIEYDDVLKLIEILKSELPHEQ